MAKVWVLSFANTGNFGDRLGVQLLSQVLPPRAIVRHVFFDPWDAPSGQTPDVLVLGVGNSLFAPLLTPSLLELVERTPRVIGIFGTQFHELMPLEALSRVLAKLDVWYARSRADLERYGHLARDARHLGDWLIDAFPMAEPRTDDILKLSAQALGAQAALDRHILMIQHHARVHSPRLHPLLCALTSARQAAYSEQYLVTPERRLPSGKFEAMLSDIFGEAPPPDQPFDVNREAVIRYKTCVRQNVDALRATLDLLIP